MKKKTQGNSSTSKDVELKSDPTSTPNVQDEILDTLEVYNSVEVIAPDIELDDYRGRSLFKGLYFCLINPSKNQHSSYVLLLKSVTFHHWIRFLFTLEFE